MYPHIFPGTSLAIPVWDIFMFLGWVIAVSLGLIMLPKDIGSRRISLFFLAVFILIFGWMGAKLFYVFLHRHMLFTLHHLNFEQAFDTAGYAYLGTLITIALTILAFTKLRLKRISFLKLSDYTMPFVLIQLFFVRIGCFFSGCCVGCETGMSWGIKFPAETGLRHPTQLYEAATVLILFFIVRAIYKKRPVPGVVTLYSVGLYAFCRFFIEFLRTDSPKVLGVVHLSNIAMFAIAAACATAIMLIQKRRGS